MKTLVNYLQLDHVGGLELLFAFYPILAGYSYGFLHMDLFLLLILDMMAMSRKKGILRCTPLKWFVVLVIVHEITVFLITGGSSTHLNNFISICIFIFSLFIIAPAINYEKLTGSISWVSILCMAGLLYHFLLIQVGHSVSPLLLLPNPGGESRANEIGDRPVSFFWEPAAYAAYMLIPLFSFITERKFAWTGVIAFTILLSTSTNGIVYSFVILAIYAFSQKVKKSVKYGIMILSIVLAFFFATSSLFEAGRDKIDSTEYEKTSRLYNGPALLMNLPTEHLLWGIPRYNIYQYYSQTNYLGATYLMEKNEEIFVPVFYFIITKYGIFVMIIYIWYIIFLFRKDKRLWPYLTTVVLSMFVTSNILSSFWVYQMAFIFAFSKTDNSHRKNKARKTITHQWIAK